MYLAMLSNEEKEMFLGLVFELATADGDYSEEEKVMINCYCQEMLIEFNQENMVKPFDDIIATINNTCSTKVKQIIIFECIGLAMVDGNYNMDERALILKMEREFNIKDGFADKCESVLNEYISFQEKMNQLVLG